MKTYTKRTLFLILLFFMSWFASCSPPSDMSNAEVSVIVKYIPPFGSDIVYGKGARATPSDVTILKIENDGVIHWVVESDTVDIKSKRLSKLEFDRLKECLRKVAKPLHNSPEAPGFVMDFSCISIECVYGKESVSWVFNMNIDEFFSNKPLPGSCPEEKWQYEEAQELKRYLVQLCGNKSGDTIPDK